MSKSSPNSPSNNRSASSHPKPGRNWPSKTGKPSGGGRDNASPKSK